MKRCPPHYQESFTRDFLAGLSRSELRNKYRRQDGNLYNQRTLRHWVSSLDLTGRHGTMSQLTPNEEAVAVAAIDRVEAAIAGEQARIDSQARRAEERRLLREAAHLDRVVQCIRDEVPRLQQLGGHLFQPVRQEGLPTESVLCFISDVQLGQKVEREGTAGLGYYNTSAFHERAERYYETVTQLVSMHRTASEIRDLHILFGGDIVEGTSIYPSQAFNIDLLTVPQVITAVKVFGEMLAQFATFLDINVHVYGVPGNHGRIARKGTEPYVNNMDTLTYRMMELHLEKQERVKFYLNDSWFQLFKIEGHLFAAEHGDSVRGSLGIPLYGLMRRHNRLVMLTGEIIEALMIGHHHVPTSAETGFGCRAYINGSWPGTSDFSSHEMGLGSVPSQLLLGVNREHGIVWERNVYLASQSEIRQLPITVAGA